MKLLTVAASAGISACAAFGSTPAAISAAAVPENTIDGSNPLVKTRFTADPAGYSDGVKPKEPMSYVMVYHKDADHSLHMAVSDDSYNWRAVNGDKPVVKGEDIAVQKGIRDPHIARTPDGVYVVAATDLHIFARQHGAIVQAPSDLVHAMERHFANKLAKEAEAL